MKIISHRGNLSGPNPSRENHPTYIHDALIRGYDVELDVWVENGRILFGHDEPKFNTDFDNFVVWHYPKLWLHCKNIEAALYFEKKRKYHRGMNYFFHDKDTMTLTSQGHIWCYPTRTPVRNSIHVLPELFEPAECVLNLSECKGICTDLADYYRGKYEA